MEKRSLSPGDDEYVLGQGYRKMSIEKNFGTDYSGWNSDTSQAFYIKIYNGNVYNSISLTDEEMQELFHAYLILRKEYEYGTKA